MTVWFFDKKQKFHFRQKPIENWKRRIVCSVPPYTTNAISLEFHQVPESNYGNFCRGNPFVSFFYNYQFIFPLLCMYWVYDIIYSTEANSYYEFQNHICHAGYIWMLNILKLFNFLQSILRCLGIVHTSGYLIMDIRGTCP